MITIKSEREIEIMRKAGKIVGELLKMLKDIIKTNITTIELDKIAEEFILSRGGKPAFKGFIKHYKKYYPCTLCTSVNDAVVHEIPTNRKLKEGDIVSIDVGVCVDGYYGDGAETYPVGEVDGKKYKLIEVGKLALKRAIDKAREGNKVSDISHQIGKTAVEAGFEPCYEFTGHGIGNALHEEPVIYTYGEPNKGYKLLKNMTLAIEVMINGGTGEVKILNDGWKVVTLDGEPSVHFERTVRITENEPEILTPIE